MMVFRQIYEEGLAQASYLVGCQATGEAMVVDPKRDIDTYLEEAQRQGLRIVGVSETHIHADYLSGARELAKATGAMLYLSDEGDQDWKYSGLQDLPYTLVKDDDIIKLGNITIQVVHTPGHTPEHISFLVTDGAVANSPSIMLTGDFVFVGDIGRPDLLEEAVGLIGTAELGAGQMFDSLKNKLLRLPDYVQIWPGHGAGSACGKSLGAVPSSTVGYERLFAWWADYLRHDDQAGFVRALLEGQPEVPSYFANMKYSNRDGMPILGDLPKPHPLSPEQFKAAQAVLVDTRDKLAFAAGHLPGSLNIPAGKNFSTWAGWLLPYDQPLVLLAQPEAIEGLMRQLVRIGLDNVQGYIPSLQGYALELETTTQINATEAKQMWESGALVLDVRGLEEHQALRIPGAMHIHAGQLMKNLARIPKDQPLLLYCLGGDRSSTAISALMHSGYTQVFNLSGGIRAWQKEGFPLEQAKQKVGV